jgi:hypothetical protein
MQDSARWMGAGGQQLGGEEAWACHAHPVGLVRTRWERQPKRESQRRGTKKQSYLHCLYYASRGIHGLMYSCSEASQSHARTRKVASPWMTCSHLGPGGGMRTDSG